jgi:hypothetical protein
VGKKRKRGDQSRVPVGGSRVKQADQHRKLSVVIKEMALRLFKEPEAAHSYAALQTAILLATAAWNAALGEHGLRDQHRVVLASAPSSDA